MDKKSTTRLAVPLLVVLLVATVASLVHVEATPGLTERSGLVRGWDFQQFYLAGLMLNRGQANELYDADRFQAVQRELFPVDEQNIPYLPLYPPVTGLLAAPLAWLPYTHALGLWWLLNTVCFATAGWILVRHSGLSEGWRWTVALAIAGCYPFFMALRAGQISPVLLLVAVAGLALLRRERNTFGGLALSLLMLKPQFAAGMLLWLLLRRDWRACAGFLVGIMIQVAAVAVAVGPTVVTDYVWSTSTYLSHSQFYIFPPGWVHSLAGTLANLLALVGLSGADVGGVCKVVHAAVLLAMAATVAVASWRKRTAVTHPGDSAWEWRYQHSVAVLFMLLLTPHLLLYDLVLLLVPMVYLLETPRWRLSLVLYITTGAVVMPLYAWADVSLVPFVLLAILYGLAGGAAIGTPIGESSEFFAVPLKNQI